MAGVNASAVTVLPSRIVAAFSTSPRTSTSSAAAASSSERVAGGRPEPCAANARSRRSVSGNRDGSNAPSSRCSDRKAAGNSISASGLPAASWIIRSRGTGPRPGAQESSSSPAAFSLSPSSRNSVNPASSSGFGSLSRTAISIRAGSVVSRRATNARTEQLGWSSHWASSMISSTGELSAASPISSSVASPVMNSSGATCSDMPNAASSAACWRVGRPSAR